MKKIDRSTLTVIRCAIPLCLSFLIVVGVIFTAVFRPSLGWFAISPGVTTSGMVVVTSSDDCDVLIERGNEFDKTKTNGVNSPIERYPGVGALKELRHFPDGASRAWELGSINPVVVLRGYYSRKRKVGKDVHR